MINFRNGQHLFDWTKLLPRGSCPIRSNLKQAEAMAFPRVRIAVVGDVHGDWDPIQDARALQALKPDLVLFTGDFGDENVNLVEHIGNLDFPKAVILGNHDCWFTREFSTSPPDAVQLQLQSLGESHVGYKRMDFSNLKLSVVGGRPFSSGGKSIGSSSRLISERYDVKSMKQSAQRISELALEAPIDHVLVFLAHDGPTGLGSNPEDICGKDWDLSSCGDHGDPDLEEALRLVKDRGAHKIQLVAFGHMHKILCYDRGFRTMLVVGPDKTLYVNAAVVPRVRDVRMLINENESSSNQGLETERNFTIVELIDGEVDKVTEVWVRVGDIVSGKEETILFSACNESTTSTSIS